MPRAGLLKDGTSFELISASGKSNTMTLGKIAPDGALQPHEMRTALPRSRLTRLLYEHVCAHHSDAIEVRVSIVHAARTVSAANA